MRQAQAIPLVNHVFGGVRVPHQAQAAGHVIVLDVVALGAKLGDGGVRAARVPQELNVEGGSLPVRGRHQLGQRWESTRMPIGIGCRPTAAQPAGTPD